MNICLCIPLLSPEGDCVKLLRAHAYEISRHSQAFAVVGVSGLTSGGSSFAENAQRRLRLIVDRHRKWQPLFQSTGAPLWRASYKGPLSNGRWKDQQKPSTHQCRLRYPVTTLSIGRTCSSVCVRSSGRPLPLCENPMGMEKSKE